MLAEGQKYVALLVICVVVLGVGFAVVLRGMQRRAPRPDGVAHSA